MNDKAQVLMPQGWSLPERGLLPDVFEVRSDTCVEVPLQGMEVVGCPVGSKAFQDAFVEKTLVDATGSREDLVRLHPQCAVRLLTQCVAAVPSYVSQVVHSDSTRVP